MEKRRLAGSMVERERGTVGKGEGECGGKDSEVLSRSPSLSLL
jgi:hypothetical protein